MNSIPLDLSCKKFQESFSARLQKAGNDAARFRLYTAGLTEFSRKILPKLQSLGVKDGTSSNSYQQGQHAATNLLQALAGPYLRSCHDFNAGVILFADLITTCSDPVLKRRLVAYSNQLKTEWNKLEPGGLSHNPRAAKRRNLNDSSESQWHIGIGLFLLLLLCGAVFFSGMSSNPRPMAAAKKSLSPQPDPYPLPVASITIPPPAPQIEQPTLVPNQRSEVSGIYRFTDKQGVIHFVASLEQIPAEYRSQMKFTSTKSLHTEVAIRGGRVLVPVELSNGHTVVRTHLLLDTGATITTISENLAARLGISAQQTWPSTARVADGRIVPTRLAKINRLDVGRKSQQNAMVSILSGSGDGGESEGLLGMSFMQHFRYELDFEDAVIRWKD